MRNAAVKPAQQLRILAGRSLQPCALPGLDAKGAPLDRCRPMKEHENATCNNARFFQHQRPRIAKLPLNPDDKEAKKRAESDYQIRLKRQKWACDFCIKGRRLCTIKFHNDISGTIRALPAPQRGVNARAGDYAF